MSRGGGGRRGRPLPLALSFVALVALVVAAAAAASVYVSIQASHDAEHTAQRDARFAARTAAGRLGKSVASMQATIVGVAGTLRGRPIPAHFTSACTLTYSGTDALPTGHVDIL